MLYRHGLVTIKIKYTQPHGQQTVYQRAVPKELQQRYGKKIIKVLIPSQDAATVAREATRITSQIETEWQTLRADLDAHPVASHAAPRELRARAIDYLAQYNLQPLDGLKSTEGPHAPPLRAEQMIDLLHDDLSNGPPQGPLQQAIASTAVALLHEHPRPLITDLRDLYLDTHRKANQANFRKVTNIAFDSLVSAIGDKPVTEVTRDDARQFIKAEAAKGNKTTTVRRRLNTYGAAWKAWRLERDAQQINPFESLAIAGEGDDSTERHSYTTQELQTLFTECRTLDDDIRWLYAMMIDTGARVAEVTGLALSDIRLTRPDGTPEPVPYVELKPHPWRSIKTNESRTIPLVGASLWAAKRVIAHAQEVAAKHAPGTTLPGSPVDRAMRFAFPRYVTPDTETKELVCRAGSSSATLNKWVSSLNLPGTNHSIRHSMEDRFRGVQCPVPISDSMTGHGATNVRDEYGRGWSLEVKREWLDKVALKV